MLSRANPGEIWRSRVSGKEAKIISVTNATVEAMLLGNERGVVILRNDPATWENYWEPVMTQKDVDQVADALESYAKQQAPAVPAADPVSKPAHYRRGKIEVIDFILDQGLGYCLGNVIKYVCRAGFKDPATHVQDLEKALWYLQRHLAEVKKASDK